MAVEERELLLAMGGVVRRIEIDRDAPGAAAKAGAVLPDHEVCQRVPQPGQRQRAKRILEARQRRLRRKAGPASGSRSSRSLWIASSVSRAVSLQSG